MEKRVIPRKEADTLYRWSIGAQARIKVMKMKRDLMREIACKFNLNFNKNLYYSFEKAVFQRW